MTLEDQLTMRRRSGMPALASTAIRRTAVTCTTVALAAAGVSVTAHATAAEMTHAPLVAYTLAAPRTTSQSGVVARAVVAGGTECPTMTVTLASGATRALGMAHRAAPPATAPAFDAITVCSANLPVGARAASVAGRVIPAAMPTTVQRVAIFGDSGCRIQIAWVQDCADASQWPLARIAQSVANTRPDVIVFTGDFFYRESACPPGNQPSCGTSPPPLVGAPFTDSAYGWIADALLPMSSMFASAPIVAMRGNHEECSRAGNGFFLLFDPRADSANTCAPTLIDGSLTAPTAVPTNTYAIDLPVGPRRTLRLAMVDSNGGNDLAVSPYAAVQRVSYEQAAHLTEPVPGRESWLLTHRPVYGYVSDTFAVPGVPFSPWFSADQGAAAWGLLDTYDLVVSSHLHQAQAVQLPGLPAQLVLGNGGTVLNPTIGYALPRTGAAAGDGRTYPAPTWAWNAVRFGYAIAEPQARPGQWRFTMRSPDGTTFAHCGLRTGFLYCTDTR